MHVQRLIINFFEEERKYAYMFMVNGGNICSDVCYAPHKISDSLKEYKSINDVYNHILDLGYISNWKNINIVYKPLYDSLTIELNNLLDIYYNFDFNMEVNTLISDYKEAIPLFTDLLKLIEGFVYQTYINGLELFITYKINFNDIVLYLDKINTSIDINKSNPRDIFMNLDFERIKINENTTWIKYNNTNRHINEKLIIKMLNAIKMLNKCDVYSILTFNNTLSFDENVFDYHEIKEHINTPDFLNYIASNINNIQVFDNELINFLNIKRL